MTPSRRRLFTLLGAYEDLTERESSALRRGDVHYVLAIQERKGRLTEALQQARRATELSAPDSTAWTDRVRSLQARETDNLRVLRGRMAEIQRSLAEIGQAAQRSRNIRRSYTGFGAAQRVSSTGMLGCA